MRRHAIRLSLVVALALSMSACQRTLVALPGENTPEATGTVGEETPERTAWLDSGGAGIQYRADASADWQEAVDGQPLAIGAQVRTGDGVQALIRLTEGSRIRLGPDTTLTLNILNPYLDSLLTSVALDSGQVWVLLNGGAMDIETPLGIVAARSAYLSADYQPASQTIFITCLQGTCSLDKTFVPANFRLEQTGLKVSTPKPMELGDYAQWGAHVPEATQLAALATAAVVPTKALPTARRTSTSAAPSATLAETPTLAATASLTLPPTITSAAATAAATVWPTQVPVTRVPLAPIMGHHTVADGETLYCIARAYGVQPAAIVQANGLVSPSHLLAGQVLGIPQVQWTDISAGPVCVRQFASLYPGLTPPTDTALPPTADLTTPEPLVISEVAALCVGYCETQDSEYRLRIIVQAHGGKPPLIYTPGQEYDLYFPRCTNSTGTVTVVSSDGQMAIGVWYYNDMACTPTPAP